MPTRTARNSAHAAATRATKNHPRPFKRTGLHRLNCPMCTGYTYSTIACLETVGLPACACGETFEPERLEVALMLGLDTPVTQAYGAKVASVQRGQASHVQRGNGEHLESPEYRALFGDDRTPGILEQQRDIARVRRLAAIGLAERRVTDPENPRKTITQRYRVDTDPIPF